MLQAAVALVLIAPGILAQGPRLAAVRGRQAQAQPVQFSISQSAGAAGGAGQFAAPTAALAASEDKAKSAVAAAEAAAKEVERITQENLGYIPIVQGAESEAKVALQTAKDAAAEAHALVAKTIPQANAVAMQAAKDYLMEVKQAAKDAIQGAADARAKAESAAEEKAAKAAAAAVEPYHLNMMRGQKVLVAYQTRAQELAAASNNLKAQAQMLASSAPHYQLQGHVIQANQIMMQAHELFNYADMMKKEALRLHGIATQIGGAMPAYAEAAQAASDAAQEAAGGGDLPAVPMPYFVQRSAHRSLRHTSE